MRKNKRQRKIYSYLLIILGITVGFALLSTTLYINGTANIKSNTWNIHWDDTSINVTTGSVTATDPVVSNATAPKDTVSFEVNLELPGDYYEFTIDAINEGSIDGELDVITTKIYNSNDQELTGNNIPSYLKYSIKYGDNTDPTVGDILTHNDSQTYKIRVEYDSEETSTRPSDEVYTIKINVPYIQHKETTPTPSMFKVGDVIQMTSTPDTTNYVNGKYKVAKEDTGYSNDQYVTTTNLNLWRVIKINDNQTVEMVSENATTESIYFSGVTGYKKYIKTLNTISKEFENPTYTIGSRSIGYKNQTEEITDTKYFDGLDPQYDTAPWSCNSGEACNPVENLGGGDTGYTEDIAAMQTASGHLYASNYNAYWLASRAYLYTSAGEFSFKGNYIVTSLYTNYMRRYNSSQWVDSANSGSIRPVVILKAGLTATGEGTIASPYILN